MLEILKELVSNEMEVMCLKVAELDSRMPMEDMEPEPSSVKQENKPVDEFQLRVWDSAEQEVRPAPNSLETEA